MKSKIRFRLLLYFAISLAVFALVIGIVFTILFTKTNMNIHKKDLEARAVKIAETLSSFPEQDSGHGSMRQGSGHGAYLRFLDDIAMTDVWLVDPDLNQIIRGHGQTSLTYSELPENAENVIVEAISGNISFSENFSSLLESPSLTVATPIVLNDNSIAGVVLLHMELDDISSSAAVGFGLLAISIVVAIIISFAIARALSLKFTKPLERMKCVATKISSGNFGVSTEIVQNDEIGELAKAMDEMSAQLERASKESELLDKLRRDFMANISHELRTPVTVLRGSLEALCDGVITNSEMIDDYHTQMLNESIHLERLVSDLMDLSKLQNPDFNIEMQKVNIKDILSDAVHSMEYIAKDKQIQIIVECENMIFDYLGDYGRLRQMILIVLNNAIKFSPNGESVNVTLSNQSKQMILSIKDKGCGISKEDLPYIFDRFHKQQTEKNQSGTGLGLAIAKEIADRHKIGFNIESDLGKGTTVRFIFEKNTE